MSRSREEIFRRGEAKIFQGQKTKIASQHSWCAMMKEEEYQERRLEKQTGSR
jgi:hypothetical protein